MKKFRNIFVVLLSVLLFLPALGRGWAREGHELVAGVAQSLLRPKTLQALDALRRDKGLKIGKLMTRDSSPYNWFVDTDLLKFLDTAAKLDLSLISTWPDAWKTHHKETGNWHFIDIPTDLATVTPADLPRYCFRHGCVVDQIELDRAALADPKMDATRRMKALFFLVHFVADVHQPLHCATDRFLNMPSKMNKIPSRHNGDNGGNFKEVLFFGEPQNLHLVFDLSILEKTGQTGPEMTRELIHSLTPQKIRAWQAGTPEDWAIESYRIARDRIYKEYPRGGAVPYYAQKYEDEMAPLVKERLARAGVRLAWILNEIFDK